MATLKTKVNTKARDTITLEIRRDDLEAFCGAVGLYRKDFLDLLEASVEDHKEGRITERKSLSELIKKKEK